MKWNILFVILMVGNMACNTTESKLQNGDLLFRARTVSALSGAIDKVTQTNKATHYSHIGVVEIVNSQVFVLHAAPEKGVCKETLAKFMASNSNENIQTDVYRLKPGFQETIPKAIRSANALLGQPYDYTYILESKGFYCSEFVQQIFVSDSVFALEPMTFKDPETKKFFPTWVEHYAKLGVEIPEGKLGCNPNGMATNSAIVFITSL